MLDVVRSTPTLNPVDYAVISQSLLAAAREMGVKLIRSSYSTIVREAQDASAALFDRDGNVVAQAELVPLQLCSMSDIFRACARLFPPETLKEGDFYINSDPYSGGQHLQDVFIYSPIFLDGELIGFAGTVAHHLDLGGGNPGMTPDAVDVHAEGIIFPPSVYSFDRDWNGGPLERFVAANIRVPHQTIGDFYAQFAANAVGVERMRQLARKYGTDRLDAAMRELMDYSERRFRAAITEVPDGVYEGEDAVDDDGVDDEPLRVRARVEITGDRISVDYSGTCDQVSCYLNCPFASTVSATLTVMKSVLTDPEIPFNEGLKRPVEISAPSGSIVNPEYPVPVRARTLVAYRCFNAIMKALAKAVPDRVIAGGNDTSHSLCFSKLNNGRYKVYHEIYGGGFGASLDQDGCDGVDSVLSNCTNAPIETIDADFEHVRIVEYGLLTDTGGPGRYRGGLGLFRRFEILQDGVNFASYSDRMKLEPYALDGGHRGTLARIEIERDGEVIPVASKQMQVLKKGDIVVLYSSGGGGYGDPAERAPEAIADDLRNGLISLDAARELYGAAVE